MIPKANERELEEIPADVRSQLKFHAVATMDEVLGLAFTQRPAVPSEAAEMATAPALPPPLAH